MRNANSQIDKLRRRRRRRSRYRCRIRNFNGNCDGRPSWFILILMMPLILALPILNPFQSRVKHIWHNRAAAGTEILIAINLSDIEMSFSFHNRHIFEIDREQASWRWLVRSFESSATTGDSETSAFHRNYKSEINSFDCERNWIKSKSARRTNRILGIPHFHFIGINFVFVQ